MVEAKEDVNKMKAELAIKNQELAAASKEAEALLKSISESTAIAEKGESAAVCLQLCSVMHAAHQGWAHLLRGTELSSGNPLLHVCSSYDLQRSRRLRSSWSRCPRRQLRLVQ